MHKTFNAKCNLAKVCVHVYCVCVWVQVHDLSVCMYYKKCMMEKMFHFLFVHLYYALIYTVCSMHIALAHKLFLPCFILLLFFCMCVLPAVLLIIFLCVIQHFFFYYLSMYTSQLCIFCAFLCTCGLWYPVSYYIGIGQKLCFHMVWNRLLLLSG